MVGVGVGEGDGFDVRGVKAGRSHVGQDEFRFKADAGVDQRQWAAAVDEVYVAVVGVGQVGAGGAAADQVYAPGQAHQAAISPKASHTPK